MGGLSPEERPLIGQLANSVRVEIENAIAARVKKLRKKNLRTLISETIDVTLPGKVSKIGKLHPLNIVLNEIKEIFIGMGFDIAEGPEVEYNYYNFDALIFHLTTLQEIYRIHSIFQMK